MNNTVTLKDAFIAWEKYRLQNSGEMEHIEEVKLKSLFQGITEAKNRDIEHLILCSTCLKKFTAPLRQTESTELWETAWRKAAATGEIRWPQELTSKNGTYEIKIRQSETWKNRGLIVVTINEKQRDQFEGKIISVVDGKGRVLLKGLVHEGEVFQRIKNLDTIDLRLLVKTED